MWTRLESNCHSTQHHASGSVVDPEAELIDPTPDIRALFLQFNEQFFHGVLAACEVRWSPRMTSCAGLCHYEGHGGLCSIRLSVPLLKLRPRKDLVETLLHKMIHAYLFVTANNRDHDGHGPEFQKHMDRINKASGANITIYHNFHAEVDLYKQHWWRCEGICRERRPFYGWVKRAMNRTPGPSDFWWEDHRQTCGGQFIKVKEPADYANKKPTKSSTEISPKPFKNAPVDGNQRRIESFLQTNQLTKSKATTMLSSVDGGGASNSKEMQESYVECPVCSLIVLDTEINSHLDNCVIATV